MDWTELTPLSVDNLNDLEARISAADAAIITGKLNVYNAIVAKNITPTTQAFTDLVAAINLLNTVAADADLISSNIRSGKNIFGVSGNVIEGKPYATGIQTGYIDPFTVTGLNFTPKLVIISHQTSQYHHTLYNGYDHPNVYVREGTAFSCLPPGYGGFSFRVSTGTEPRNWRWWAFD